MEKQYILSEIEFLKAQPNLCRFEQVLLEEFTEMYNRVLPWEKDSRWNAGMIRSNRFKGAYYVLTTGVRIYREEYPMYYFVLRDANLTAICIPFSTAN